MEGCELERAEVEKLFLEFWQPLFVYARSARKTDSAAREAVRETFRFAFARSGALLTSPSRRVWLLLTLKYIIQNLRPARSFPAFCSQITPIRRVARRGFPFPRGNFSAKRTSDYWRALPLRAVRSKLRRRKTVSPCWNVRPVSAARGGVCSHAQTPKTI